jgi:hypothetical protein
VEGLDPGPFHEVPFMPPAHVTQKKCISRRKGGQEQHSRHRPRGWIHPHPEGAEHAPGFL